MDKKQNRRNFFRNTNFQKREILGCFLLVTGGGLLFNVLLQKVVPPSLLLSGIGTILILVASLLLSHRINGPMFRFESTLYSMMQGDLSKTIQLREKDEGRELAQRINEFNRQLSQSFCLIGQNSKALNILIDQVCALDLPEEKKEQLAGLCWAMQEHNRKITNNCNFYLSR